MSDTPLVVEHFAKQYRGFWAVEDLSVAVEPGQVIGLLGPNGSGKSTTLRGAVGLVRPDRGRIQVCGDDPAVDPVAARAHVGYVPDMGGLFPRLTGWEHCQLAARLRRLPAGWDTRARDLIDRMGLADAAGRRASGYSHGMGRKLSLVIAMLAEPRLLLLDEPFDGVDPAGSVEIRTMIGEVAAQGAAVLLSTHLLDVAEKVCDSLTVVRAGRDIASGRADDLRTQAGTDGPLEAVYLALQAEQPLTPSVGG